MRTAMPGLTALALALLCGTAIARDPAWLSLGAGNQVLARTVVPTQCPQISVDGTVSTMTARIASDGQAHTPPAHHRLVCETDVSGARHVRLGSVSLTLPPGTPQRRLCLRDT